MMYPNVRNAPGGRMKTSIPNCSGMILMSKIVPLPRSSRAIPRVVSPIVNPSPMPKPSHAEASGLFLLANDSARPRMIQFTTIRGIKRPNCLFTSGR